MREIWSSNGELGNLVNASPEEKRAYLADLHGGDTELINQLNDSQLDDYISNNTDIYDSAAEDFENNIAPVIADQVDAGLVLDENFNLVDPSVLLNYNGYSATLDEDENGELWFNVEGRKPFPILGFSPEPDDFIHQLDRLGILDTIHNLYPDWEDDDIDVYDIADLIPFNWALLEEVLTRPAVEGFMDVKEDVNIDEARTKDPNKLAKEIKKIKKIIKDNGGDFHALTNMQFTSFDNDELSIEYNFPEFFRIVKAYWKEMELADADELSDPDTLDELWDSNIFQHDWDVIMRSCDKLINGKGVQFEKEYKTGYNSPLDDDQILADRKAKEAEFEESLDEGLNADSKEALEDSFTRVTADDWSDDDLEDLYYQACNIVDDEENLSNNYDAAMEYLRKLANDAKEMLDENALTPEVGDAVRNHGGWIANLLINLDKGVDQLNRRKSLSDAEKNMVRLMKELVNLINDKSTDESLDEEVGVTKVGDEDNADRWFSSTTYIGGKNNFEVSTDAYDSKGQSKSYTASRWSHNYKNVQEVEDDIENLQALKARMLELEDKGFKNSELKESLTEDAAEETAMHELKEEVADYIYEFYLANIDDNIAWAVNASVPQYNIDWCNEEGDNFIANGVDQMKHSLARKITDALFANAPRELNVK